MSLENAHILGIAILIILTLLGGYSLILRIRDQTAERPDPKTTYAKITDLEKLAHQFETFRQTNRRDHETAETKRTNMMESLLDLINKNAQQIAALIAQSQMHNQRISELNIKTERLQEKLKT